MTPPQPTAELMTAAYHIADRKWTLGPDDSRDPGADPRLFALWQHGLVYQHFAQPSRQQDGTDEDRWALTTAGREWFAKAMADAVWGHTSGPNP